MKNQTYAKTVYEVFADKRPHTVAEITDKFVKSNPEIPRTRAYESIKKLVAYRVDRGVIKATGQDGLKKLYTQVGSLTGNNKAKKAPAPAGKKSAQVAPVKSKPAAKPQPQARKQSSPKAEASVAALCVALAEIAENAAKTLRQVQRALKKLAK